MNWDIVEGNWKQFKGRVKVQWGKLTDDQLDVIAGKRIDLAGRIQESYGVTTDEAEKQIKNFEELNKDYRPSDPS
ncbi:CsbD family protein [Accumulibacter sp.]|uniref:CsbD family protein n=1 Tax=Accumulibacter sp. TaxID=2053492 RepID=UPI0025E48E52|nr:CsbD family protein [Accumulibacter sp.]MCP5228557.1 CsbD family protein [Accumulibacter sp.]